jgi:hypothetical protein
MSFVCRSAAAVVLSAAAITLGLTGPAAATPMSTAGSEGIVTAQTAAMARGSGLTNCGSDYNYCMSLRRAMVHDGYRVGPMWFDPEGCTAPDGCMGGYKFYYYW